MRLSLGQVIAPSAATAPVTPGFGPSLQPGRRGGAGGLPLLSGGRKWETDMRPSLGPRLLVLTVYDWPRPPSLTPGLSYRWSSLGLFPPATPPPGARGPPIHKGGDRKEGLPKPAWFPQPEAGAHGRPVLAVPPRALGTCHLPSPLCPKSAPAPIRPFPLRPGRPHGACTLPGVSPPPPAPVTPGAAPGPPQVAETPCRQGRGRTPPAPHGGSPTTRGLAHWV